MSLPLSLSLCLSPSLSLSANVICSRTSTHSTWKHIDRSTRRSLSCLCSLDFKANCAKTT